MGRDDPDLEAGDEHDDWCAGVGSTDADFVEVCVVAKGDFAGVVDFVAADAVFGFGCRGGSGFGESGVGEVGGGAAE